MAARLNLQVWDSKAALLDYMEASEPHTLLVGVNAEAPRGYYSIAVDSTRGRNEIGLLTSHHDLTPVAVLLPGRRRVLIGHDSSLTWIDVEALSVVATSELPCVFYDFISVEQQGEIIAVHELGAMRVDANGSVKWSVDTPDIIESFRLDDNGNLIVDVWDGPELVVSVASGATTRRR